MSIEFANRDSITCGPLSNSFGDIGTSPRFSENIWFSSPTMGMAWPIFGKNATLTRSCWGSVVLANDTATAATTIAPTAILIFIKRCYK